MAESAYKIAMREHGDKMHANIKERYALYNLLKTDPKVVALESEKIDNDIFHWFKYYAWTFDPRPHQQELYDFKSPNMPFLLFPFQEKVVAELVSAITEGRDLGIDKTRDMGLSWLVIAVFHWFWRKKESGFDFLIGSRKEMYVDKKGVMSSLFEKFRYLLYLTPPELMVDGFVADKHDNVGLIRNPYSGNYIQGEANNSNFGTAGRYTAILLDEFSKWEETDESAWISTGDSTPCRIPVSTPWGIGRYFAKLRFGGSVHFESYHWTLHPLKSAGTYEEKHPYCPEKGVVKLSEWYIEQCERRKENPEMIGQELDIDYLSSGTPYFNNYKLREKQKLLKECPPELTEYEVMLTSPTDISVFEKIGGRLKVKSQPVMGWEDRYLVSADVAEGLEKGDNSAVYVYDRVDKEDVAWFVGKIDTDILGMLMVYLGHWYNEAYLAPEKNNHGFAVIQRIKSLDYDNIYYQETYDEMYNAETHRLGWSTNVATRPIMCAALRSAVNFDVDGINDIDFFNEGMTFVYNKNGKPEADVGNLDDRVMAQGIKFMVHQWMPEPKKIQLYEQDFAHVEQFGIPVIDDEYEDVRTIWT